MNKDELLCVFNELVTNATKFKPQSLQRERNEAYQQIKGCINEAFAILDTSEREAELVSEVSVPISDKIDERFVEEKVKDFLRKTYDKPIYPVSVRELKNFICQLISEVQPQKPDEGVAVGEVLFGKEEHEGQVARVREAKLEEFVEKWAKKWGFWSPRQEEMVCKYIRSLIKEYEELIHGKMADTKR